MALALGHRAPARPRRPPSCPEASFSASRSGPRSPAARALILLDEPTSQLDPVAGDELIALLRRLDEDFDTAIVICEHRLERCLPFADRAIAMRSGRLACDAPPGEFLAWASAVAPELATPGARLLSAVGLRAGRRGQARRARRCGQPACCRTRSRSRPGLWRGVARLGVGATAWRTPCEFDRVWHELDRGPVILRGVSLSVRAGERVALMGRNGAGKSTLLRHAAGLMRPTRGRVRSAGRVALLLQNPTDYLVHERVELRGFGGRARHGRAR